MKTLVLVLACGVATSFAYTSHNTGSPLLDTTPRQVVNEVKRSLPTVHTSQGHLIITEGR